MPKKKIGRRKPVPDKIPSFGEAISYDNELFAWSFEKCFWEHWGWQEDCESVQFFAERIIAELKCFETMTWQKIKEASGGKSEGHGTNSHSISANELPRLEKREFIRRGYFEQYDKVFSLRLSNLERLIGIVDRRMFYVL